MIKQPVKNSLKLASAAGIVFFISHILGINFIVPLTLFSLFAYLKSSSRNSEFAKCRLLNLILLFLIIFAASCYIIRRGLPIFYIPFCLIPMLSTVLFGSLGVALLLTLASAFSVSAINGSGLYLAMLFSISGISVSILVKDARRRIEIIRAGFITGIVQMAALLFIERFRISAPDRYLMLLGNSIVSSVIVVGILPVFEYLFKTATNISLLELADFNHPLLQRMILEAPGTYHHSLVVGNLSEAACRAVGAHALLARIGAYYHDIGKLSKPQYFSENQGLDISKHEALSAGLSKMVIMNHVKEGLDLAKKYKLNPCLADFISQHHGNSLVFYFYRRALESLEQDEKIEEEVFRYPGPKPNTRETAIVLLADSVEAATRALKEPSPAKVKEVVHKVINNKFIDGQLDECDLTLRDLEKIANIFIHILTGIYHSRVDYAQPTPAS